MTKPQKKKERGAIVPRHPFSELIPWERQLERILSDSFDWRWSPRRGGRRRPTRSSDITAPAIDTYEEKDDIVSNVRSLALPKDVQMDKARACFKNGLLEVRIPKTEEAKKKEFKVNVE